MQGRADELVAQAPGRSRHHREIGRAVAQATGGALVPLMIPVIILTGLLSGVMTPTEAGGVAVAYALVVSLLLTARGLGLNN